MRKKQIDIISLFPEMFQALNYGITGRALETGLLHINYWQPRDYAHNKHRSVDDRPYGGGPGMVMTVQPLQDTIAAAKNAANDNAKVIYLSPQGRVLNQAAVQQLAQQERLILVSGRYEGIDERLIETHIDEEWLIGDYILSGGELAAMVLIDAIVRLLPGALGDEESAKQDSFSVGLLDHPHYSRPEAIDGRVVPDVLISGDHRAIARWRLKQALGHTWLRRPDLLANKPLTEMEQALLDEFIKGK